MSGIRAMMAAPRRDNILKLTSLSFASLAIIPSNSICTASFLTDGDIDGNISGHADQYIDLQGTGKGARYEVKYGSVTGDTGDLTGDSTGSFHALTSQVDFILSATGSTSKFVTGTCTIREILVTSNSVSATMTLTAELDVG